MKNDCSWRLSFAFATIPAWVDREEIRQQAVRYYLGVAVSIAIAAVGGVASIDAARAACESGNIKFSDDFSRPNASWGPFSKDVFRDRKYIMTVKPNGTEADWPSVAQFSGSYTVCANIRLPFDPKGAAGSGVLFWIDPAKNNREGHNYYMAMMSPDGFYWVARQVDGTLSNVMEPVQGNLVKIGQNAVNEIAVSLNDNRGVLLINDKKAGEFTGEPPSRSFAGILAGAPLEKSYQVEFSHFQVVGP